MTKVLNILLLIINPFSAKVRRSFVEPENKRISIVRQCELLGINRSSLYYRERAERFEDAELMRLHARARGRRLRFTAIGE